MSAPMKEGRARAATKKKPATPKPHEMAFVADEPCTVCGCEWFRPTIAFVGEDASEGVACANLWCVMIATLRNQITALKTERLALARLASELPQFDNLLKVVEAQAIRDRVLAAARAPLAGEATGGDSV